MTTFRFSPAMWTFVIAAFFLAAIGAAPTEAANIPNYLFWPTDRGARINSHHGDTWYFGKGCDGQWKRHVGIDIAVGSGRPVYAAEYGHVIVVGYSQQWGYWITLQHTDWQSRPYTTNYFHVNASVKRGDRVKRGQKIGTVYNLRSNSHLHFGIRNARYSNVANRGALPRTKSCGSDDPKWPEYTVNPLDYTNPNGPWTAAAPSAKQVEKIAMTWGKIKKNTK
jgi:murein DD-endopeptidase MepM/ murein hydrolase activator NlpD